MNALIDVHLCCNHHENGHFAGRLWCVEYREMWLRHDDWVRGCAISFPDDHMVRISRRTFRYSAMRECVGNWCWSAIWMDKREAHRLLLYLRSSGNWACEAGPIRLFHWWGTSPRHEAAA